jgi:hypothetical protein
LYVINRNTIIYINILHFKTIDLQLTFAKDIHTVLNNTGISIALSTPSSIVEMFKDPAEANTILLNMFNAVNNEHAPVKVTGSVT